MRVLPGVDLEPDFLGVSRTLKLENLGVRYIPYTGLAEIPSDGPLSYKRIRLGRF